MPHLTATLSGPRLPKRLRGFVAREVEKLRSEFELRVKMLEGRGTLEYLGVHEAGPPNTSRASL